MEDELWGSIYEVLLSNFGSAVMVQVRLLLPMRESL